MRPIGREETGSPSRDTSATRPTKWQLGASAIGVTAIAASQPILDLLGKNPEFFIARAAPGSDVILLGLVLGIAVPLLVGALVMATYSIQRSVGRAFHMILLSIAGGLIVVSAFRVSPAAEQPWALVVGIAVVVGTLLTWSFYRVSWMRSFLSLLVLAPIVVTSMFLFFSSTSRIAWGIDDAAPGYEFADVGDPAPIVIVLFDEFSLASVIDSNGELQSDYFPSLAALSDDATWFRNGVGTQRETRDAIPEVLTGISQPPGKKLPHYADHPESLFSLLGGEYEVNAIETLTQLCPDEICSAGSRDMNDWRARWRSLFGDLGVVAGHLTLPTSLTAGLPPIDQNWGNFVPASVERPEEWIIRDRMEAAVDADRRFEVARFLDGLREPLESRDLHFIHLPLPHRPWTFTASGMTYTARPGLPGAAQGGWGPNEFLAEQSYQRLLLQTQYADSIVGAVVGALKETGSYDSSIVVVAADHGVAVRPNLHARNVVDESVGDIAAVPLFIKQPHQSRGRIDDYRAEITDILPTIAGLVDADVPWGVDGVDLYSAQRPVRSESSMLARRSTVTFGVSGDEKLEVAAYHEMFFGDRGPFGLAPLGYGELIGAVVGEVAAAESPVEVTFDFPELYSDVDPETEPLPIVISGTLDRQLNPGEVLTVVQDSTVLAVTESWDDHGTARFQATISPEALRPGENDFEIYTVHRSQGDYIFSQVGRT